MFILLVTLYRLERSDSFYQFELDDCSIPFRVAGCESVNSNVVSGQGFFQESNVKKRGNNVKRTTLLNPLGGAVASGYISLIVGRPESCWPLKGP